jgi:hypothetical protein
MTRVVSGSKSMSDMAELEQAFEQLDFEVSPYAEDCTKLPFDDVPIWISQCKV